MFLGLIIRINYVSVNICENRTKIKKKSDQRRITKNFHHEKNLNLIECLKIRINSDFINNKRTYFQREMIKTLQNY